MRGHRMKESGIWTEVTFNSRDPLYLQVIRHFKEQIAIGQLQAGQVIPSRRELGAQMKINPNTAQRAYKEMEEQLLIITEGNLPSRITNDVRVLRHIRSELLNDAVDSFFSSVHKIDVSLAELIELVTSKYGLVRTEDTKIDGGGEQL